MNGRLPYKKDLRLIGGGHSHVAVIKKLGVKPIPGTSVTLISHDAYTPYSGMLPGLIAGHYSFDDCHIDLRKLCQWAGIQFICGTVKHLDPVAKEIVCYEYPPLRYDLLSINIGSQTALSEIKDAPSHGHAVKPIGKFLNSWCQWLESVQISSQPQYIVVVGGGAAGVEILLAMHHRLCNTTSISAHFALVCADEKILTLHNAHVQNYFRNHFQALGIKLITGKKVVSSAVNQVLLDDGTTLDADFIAWAVNAGAQSWPVESGLQCDEQGFIQVDQFLHSISHPDIFAVGDGAAFTPVPLPKAGVYAVRQGPVLAKNLVAVLQQHPLKPYVPQHRFLSLLSTGARHAVASRGAFFASGKWVWRWKNFIDRNFVARFSPAPMVSKKKHIDDGYELMRCGGCGAKVSSHILQSVLTQLDIKTNLDIVDTQDDAAIIRPPAGLHLVQSVDFFRGFIDDAYLLGRIAAIHSLGDIYAMGGTPHSALVTAVIPYSAQLMMQESLLHLMRGVLKTLHEENTVLIGGHSGEGPEVAVGLTVNGTLQPDKALTKAGLSPGDSLILTKPLGSGVLLAANMAAHCEGRWLDGALNVMLQSNRAAVPIFRSYGVQSCTDITGFGLLGHLQEMLVASKCNATIILDALPIMEGAQQCSVQGIQSTLFAANKQSSSFGYYTGQHPNYPLLFDPQTAGGLLAGISAQHTNACLHALRNAGYTATKIGTVEKSEVTTSVTLHDQ